MRTMLRLPLFIALFAVIGCASVAKPMKAWVGRNKQELVKVLGQPMNVINNGAAGEILVYSAKTDVPPPPGVYLNYEGNGYNRIERPQEQSSQYTKVKMFYVNPAGIIYSCKTQDL